MEAAALEKKKRCPKGQIRNKEGNCAPKVEKTKVKKDTKTKKDPKTKTKKEQAKSKTKSKTKTMKKLTKKQLVEIISERRVCIQRFRDKL